MSARIVANVDTSVRLSGLTAEEEVVLKSSLQWANPDFAKRENAGRSTWGVPRVISLWQRAGSELVVPFGCMTMLKHIFGNDMQFAPNQHLMSLKGRTRAFSAEVNGLYAYQEKALECALKAKNGVLVAPCGSGKTQIGLAICAALGLRTLWLTHTSELLNQSRNRAKDVLGLSDRQLGTITAGKINVSDCITFATVQTMSKIDLIDFRYFWDVIIVDECQHACGTPAQLTMFWKVVSNLSARYKIGLTATPKRADGMQRSMFALLGPKFYEITREEVRDTTCPLCVSKPIETHWNPDIEECLNPDGTLNYAALIKACVTDEERNQIVADLINDIANDGPVMVLSERIEHLEILSSMCDHENGILSIVKKSERQTLLDGMREGKVKVLFATFAIAKEGLDIPCLKHLVMASPIKDETAVIQSAGRVMRKFPDKKFGTVWEFEDSMMMLKAWLRRRLRFYDRLMQ